MHKPAYALKLLNPAGLLSRQLQVPWAMVYEVEHCGFTIALRELDDDGDWDTWELIEQDSPMVEGVFWLTNR